MSVRPVANRVRALVALAAIAAVPVLFAPPAGAAPAPATTTDPTAAAAGWLARQFVDGTHLSSSYGGQTFADYGGTIDAVLGLAAAKTGRTTIDAATAWLAENVAAYSAVDTAGSDPGPYDGSLGKLALAAIVTGNDPTDFGGYNLLRTLHEDECTQAANTDGSDRSEPLCPAPGAARNIYSSVSESLVILAEARAGGAYSPSPDAVAYFLSLQCPGGGFTGGTSACTDDADAQVDQTAYAAMALAALGGEPSALERAVTWLAGQRDANGYWVVQGGPDVDSTGLATAVLDAAGKDVSASREWIAGQQVTAGPTVGEGASRGALKYQGAFDPAASIKATADGLIGLGTHATFATLTAAGAADRAPVLALAPPALRSATLARGGEQAVTGTGFAAGETVGAVLHSDPLAVGSARADAHGSVTLRFAVPTAVPTGPHTVTLTGRTSGLAATSAAFTVTPAIGPSGPATPSPAPGTAGSAGAAGNCDPSELACTGRDGRRVRAEWIGGVGLLVLGAAALWLGRRRRA